MAAGLFSLRRIQQNCWRSHIERRKANYSADNSKFEKYIERVLEGELKQIQGFSDSIIGSRPRKPFLYTAGLLLFCSSELNPDDHSKGCRLKNLAAGIEILALGCEFHFFDVAGFRPDFATDEGENYVLYLLIGDILYSRSINYLIKYEEKNVYDQIISSLKDIHKSRLLIHSRLTEAAEKPGLLGDLADDCSSILSNANSLFKSCLFLSKEIFKAEQYTDRIDSWDHIINCMARVKTLREIGCFLDAVLPKGADTGLLRQKRQNIAHKLEGSINQITPDWLRGRLQYVLNEVCGKE